MSTHPALAIGALAGGPDLNSEWEEAVKRLGRKVMALRDGVESPLSVNVVYQIPGKFLQPDFEGARSGRFSRKERRLLVQVSLPTRPGADPYEEARGRLSEAITLAERFAFEEGLIDRAELLSLRDLVGRL